MRKLPIYLLLTLLAPLYTANAADCVAAACIDVYTHEGQIIIEGKNKNTYKSLHIQNIIVLLHLILLAKAVLLLFQKSKKHSQNNVFSKGKSLQQRLFITL